MTFLLLRPQAKCQASVEAFQAAKLNAVACGLIDTVLDEQAIAELPSKIASLTSITKQTVFVIVTSTVAASQVKQLKDKWPTNITFFAVGHSTARILQSANVDVITPQEARTEGLLALPQLVDISRRNIVIMKGFGGRELLRDKLVERGATVAEWEVYKRVKLNTPLSTQDWHTTQIRCIIATSGEVIQAAFEHFDPKWLKTLSWIVVSQRTADIAAMLGVGVTQIDISRDASDQALIQSAQQFFIRARHSLEH
jgi:uroporphyrinogen-III synthase